MKEPKASRPTAPDWLGGDDLLPWTWAVEHLDAERNYWIVSVRRDGFPQARPVWGSWDDTKGVLYLSVGHGGLQRAGGQRPDGRRDVQVHIDSAVDVVILEGTIERVAGKPRAGQHAVTKPIPSASKRIVERYNAKYDWDATASLLNFAMRPRVVYGWADEDVKTATRWTFA